MRIRGGDESGALFWGNFGKASGALLKSVPEAFLKRSPKDAALSHTPSSASLEKIRAKKFRVKNAEKKTGPSARLR